MKFIAHDPGAQAAKQKNKHDLSAPLQPNPVLKLAGTAAHTGQPAASSSTVAGPSSSNAPVLYQQRPFTFRSPLDQPPQRNAASGRFSLAPPKTGPPPPLPRPAPPRKVIIPLVNKDINSAPLNPIVYQTLTLMLEDLNRLLYTPHEGQPFDFRGLCAIIADPAIENAERVRIVAAQVAELTVLSFNPYTLSVQDFPQGAACTIPTSALWMGAAPDLPANVSCRHCEHLLTISVTHCRGPLIRGQDITGYRGQRIIVAVTHFAGHVSDPPIPDAVIPSDSEHEHEPTEELAPLAPNATEKEHKRRQNTLAARRSRKRKLVHQQELEETFERLSRERDFWRTRVMMLRDLAMSHGLPCPEFEDSG